MKKYIEVIDQYNARHRFPKEGHYYEWRLKSEEIEIVGDTLLDIFGRCEDDEDFYEVVATFPNPACVGIVTEDTALLLPMRELSMVQCPQCGYVTEGEKL